MRGIQRSILIFLLFFYTIIIYCQSNSDFKIIESNSRRLIVEISPIYSDSIESLKIESEYFDIFKFKNSTPISSINYFSVKGHPSVHLRNLLTGLPSLGNHKVQAVPGEYDIIRNINLLPVPEYLKKDSIGLFPVYKKNQNIYNNNSFYPENIACLFKPGIARDLIIANLVVFPYQYNPVTKEIKRYKKITVSIEFNQDNINNSYKRISSSKSDGIINSAVINYTQAQNWKIQTKNNGKSFTSVKNSVLSSGDWYKIEVSADGIYKLDASFFKNAGININSIDPRTLKIYGNGGLEVPENVNDQRINDLLECAIFVSGEEDGIFNDNDYVLFYGKSSGGWNYNPDTKKYSHYINHFSSSNYYFLTFGGQVKGKRMEIIPSINSSDKYIPSYLSNRFFIEPEVTSFANSGRELFGDPLTIDRNNHIYSSDNLDGFITGQNVIFRTQFAVRSDYPSSFEVYNNNELLKTLETYKTVALNDEQGFCAEKTDPIDILARANLKDGKMNIKIKFNSNSKSSTGCLDWMEIFYSRSLNTGTDEIFFNTPDTNCIVEYRLGGFSSSGIFVFKIDEHNSVKNISGSEISGGDIKFRVNAYSGRPIPYYVIGNKGFKSISRTTKINNSNLHGFSSGSEVIVITHPDFISEANRYKLYRESNNKNRLTTYVVNISDIYNEFSGGLQDPIAIRDFVKYAFENWTLKPKHLLLLGDGTYNCKSESKYNKIITYQTYESLNQNYSYCSDDFFVQVAGSDERNDLGVGRIPITTLVEAKNCIDKIISYESTSSIGIWRNILTFVGDDGIRGSEDDGDLHTSQVEDIADNACPVSFNKKRIYLISYPTVFSASGRIKPDVNRDIIDQINKGTLILVYFGHSSDDYWAHEHVFTPSEAANELKNGDKLPFVVSASCGFGKYDKIGTQSGGEELTIKDNCAAIGVFSATRSVHPYENYTLTKSLYQNIFRRDHNGKILSIGDAICITKQYCLDLDNIKFNLLGDPSIKLNIPEYSAVIDSINGNPAENTSKLSALNKVTIKGKILNQQNAIWKEFNGKINIRLNDAEKFISIKEGYGTFNFKEDGGLLFNGDCSVKNGEFTSTFYIPKDISYENSYGRITLYFNNGIFDGSGVKNNIIIGGSDISGNIDVKGPVINIYLGDRNFKDGDLTNMNPTLIVDFFDESGINISGGIGHRFEALLDNNIKGISLIEYYKGNTDNFQEGSAEYNLTGLSSGSHKLKVKAFDVFNNRTEKEVGFRVSSGSNLSIENVMNFPNPFGTSTKFTFQQNGDQPIDVGIKIYTVAGRLIKKINDYGITDKFVQIDWDGLDEDGDEIANGVYLYKVSIRTPDGKYSAESLGKLSKLK